ncbi:hypothetical protein [Streptomyces cyaneogriseus]|nr:hypothetical protein [Streptomyces cyaneogriseus]
MTWQRQESNAAGRPRDPDGWGVLIGRALAAYSQHLATHLPA